MQRTKWLQRNKWCYGTCEVLIFILISWKYMHERFLSHMCIRSNDVIAGKRICLKSRRAVDTRSTLTLTATWSWQSGRSHSVTKASTTVWLRALLVELNALPHWELLVSCLVLGGWGFSLFAVLELLVTVTEFNSSAWDVPHIVGKYHCGQPTQSVWLGASLSYMKYFFVFSFSTQWEYSRAISKKTGNLGGTCWHAKYRCLSMNSYSIF